MASTSVCGPVGGGAAGAGGKAGDGLKGGEGEGGGEGGAGGGGGELDPTCERFNPLRAIYDPAFEVQCIKQCALLIVHYLVYCATCIMHCVLCFV